MNTTASDYYYDAAHEAYMDHWDALESAYATLYDEYLADCAKDDEEPLTLRDFIREI